MGICNTFNSFFIHVGPSLSKTIPSVNTGVSKLISRSENSIYLTPTSEEEICRILNTFKKSSPRWAAISAKIIKSIIVRSKSKKTLFQVGTVKQIKH